MEFFKLAYQIFFLVLFFNSDFAISQSSIISLNGSANFGDNPIMKDDQSGNLYIASDVTASGHITSVFGKANTSGALDWSFNLDLGGNTDLSVTDMQVQNINGNIVVMAVGNVNYNSSAKNVGFILLIDGSDGSINNLQTVSYDGKDVLLLDGIIFVGNHTDRYYVAGQISNIVSSPIGSTTEFEGFICVLDPSFSVLKGYEVTSAQSDLIAVSELMSVQSAGARPKVMFFGDVNPFSLNASAQNQLFDGEIEFTSSTVANTVYNQYNHNAGEPTYLKDAMIDNNGDLNILFYGESNHGANVYSRVLTSLNYTKKSSFDKALWDFNPSRFYEGDELVLSTGIFQPSLILNGKYINNSPQQGLFSSAQNLGLTSYAHNFGELGNYNKVYYNENSVFTNNTGLKDVLKHIGTNSVNNKLLLYEEEIVADINSCNKSSFATDDVYSFILAPATGITQFGVILNSLLSSGALSYTRTADVAQITKACPPPIIIYVDKDNLSGIYDGTSWSTAYQNPQDAFSFILSNPNPPRGYEVWVADGTYKPTNTTNENISFEIPINTAMYGGFDGSEVERNQRDVSQNICILSGDLGGFKSHHIFISYNSNENTILDGFTLENGYADGTPISDKNGAAMVIDRSEIIISNCIFRFNEADSWGGAVSVINSSAPEINNCLFYKNIAWRGGALHFDGSADARLINCTISQNYATKNTSSLPYPTNLPAGGGIADLGSQTEVHNSLIYGNNDVTWDNFNTASPHIYSMVGSGQIGFFNSSIEDAGPSGATWHSDFGTDLTQNIDLDNYQIFHDQINDDYRLNNSPTGTPAINGGSNSSLTINMNQDIAGKVRIQSTVVDLGCYEANPSISLKLRPSKSSESDEVTEIESIFDYLIYPNPTANKVNVIGKSYYSGVYEIVLFNVKGQVVYQNRSLTNNGIKDFFDVSKLERGVYLLQIISESDLSSRKIIIN